MIREFLDYLVGLGKESQRAVMISSVQPSDPYGRFYVDKAGHITTLNLGVPPRNFEVHTVTSFVSSCLKYGVSSISVWVDHSQITGILNDDDDRRSVCSLSLRLSPTFRFLERIGQQELPLKTFVREFRQNIKRAACEVDPPTTLASLEQTKTTDATSLDNRANVSGMGKSIVLESTGSGPIPQTVKFTFPAYPGVGEFDHKVAVESTLEFIPEEKAVHMLVMPGDIEAAKERALLAMKEHVTSAFLAATIAAKVNVVPVSIFCGKPAN